MDQKKLIAASIAIRELRASLDYDQDLFGRKIGVTQPMVSYYEDPENKKGPGKGTKKKILTLAQRKGYVGYQRLRELLSY